MIRHAGFTGTREGMTAKQKAKLREVLPAFDVFHHGDCLGADEEAHAIAKGKERVIHPASFARFRAFCKGEQTLKPRPYLKRNKDIVDQCHHLFAAPREREEQQRSGTWSTIRYARKKGKPVTILYPW